MVICFCMVFSFLFWFVYLVLVNVKWWYCFCSFKYVFCSLCVVVILIMLVLVVVLKMWRLLGYFVIVVCDFVLVSIRYWVMNLILVILFIYCFKFILLLVFESKCFCIFKCILYILLVNVLVFLEWVSMEFFICVKLFKRCGFL